MVQTRSQAGPSETLRHGTAARLLSSMSLSLRTAGTLVILTISAACSSGGGGGFAGDGGSGATQPSPGPSASGPSVSQSPQASDAGKAPGKVNCAAFCAKADAELATGCDTTKCAASCEARAKAAGSACGAEQRQRLPGANPVGRWRADVLSDECAASSAPA